MPAWWRAANPKRPGDDLFWRAWVEIECLINKPDFKAQLPSVRAAQRRIIEGLRLNSEGR